MTSTLWESDGTIDISRGDDIPVTALNDTLEIGCCPIGGIVGWAKSLTGSPSIPQGWKECDGTAVSDAESPLNGQTIPDLNSTNRFIRGATTSGTTGGTDTHSHNETAGGFGATLSGGGGQPYPLPTDDHKPPYYHVVWIVRIK